MDKITKKEEAELELEEEDRELESEDEEFFDDIEEENISTKQKFLLILTGVIAFLLFVILLFPVEEILRTFLLKKFQESGLTVDFKKISLPLWGNKQIDSLYFLTSDNIELKAEEINTDISIIQLYKNKILGKLNTVSFNLDTVSLIINLRGLNFDIDLSNLEKGMLVASGEIKIQGVNGKISKMPIFPYIRDLSGTKIKSFSLDIKKIGSKLIIEKGVFNLSIAKIRLKGKVDYSGSLK
ncbi:MAG: hypothetical protein KDK36_17805, partial [Leptospiraceae bacterium]|nr:hypothetical protein [Leptospiraceae bacterium]